MSIKPFVMAFLFSAGAAQASIWNFTLDLAGANESPPVVSAGTGSGTVSIDDVAFTLQLDVTFSGLTGTTTATHIHAATAVPFAGNAGVATTTPTFTGFPSGVSSGSYSQLFDMTLASSYNATYITNNGGTTASAFAALLAAANNGQAYLNIHTSTSPGGEIRGFVTPVPETGSSGLLLLGAAGCGLFRRRVK
ncbi:MAG: CHRD domain-containing protein [Verrucomicrobiota bacterium]